MPDYFPSLRTLPKNDRVVSLVGALIDDDYTSGSNAVVLFIMLRYTLGIFTLLSRWVEYVGVLSYFLQGGGKDRPTNYTEYLEYSWSVQLKGVTV